MHAVDTNVLVRLVVRDADEQVAAADEFVAAGAWVSHLVLAETLWVLASVYALISEQLAMAVRMLLQHDAIVLQEADVVEAALDAFHDHSKVTLADCLIVEIARKAGHEPVGTFDRALSALPGAVDVGGRQR